MGRARITRGTWPKRWSGLLETIANFRRLFGEIHRVLRPSGTVAGITSNGECSWYRLRKFIEGGERHRRTRQLATARGLDHVLQQCWIFDHASWHGPRERRDVDGINLKLINALRSAASCVLRH
jgi:hypothetical protein